MPRPPAKFTEKDVERALKAARKVGGDDMAVRLLPDGSLEIYRRLPGEAPLAPVRTWVT